MGITLATIFTMLRLANEAKMRQVICSGACLTWACGSPGPASPGPVGHLGLCLTWACGSGLNQGAKGDGEGDKGSLAERFVCPHLVVAQSLILFGSHSS